jgi:hypothetical protein
LQKGFGSPERRPDFNSFLRICASGDGIINLHHLITFYVWTEWEKAPFNKEARAPYGLLVDWLKEKRVDRQREQAVAAASYAGKMPDTYKAFSKQFSFEKPDESIACIYRLLEERPGPTIDWLFRFYAENYSPETWDPHYYTGLYAALTLYSGETVKDVVSCRMALDQALRYFMDGLR